MRKSDPSPALVEAFASLTAEGVPVTVRTLRERARVGTDAARDWLSKNRPTTNVPEPPTEVLSALIGSVWAAAMSAARDEVAESTASEVSAAHESESTALLAVERLTAELKAAEAESADAVRETQRLADEIEQIRAEIRAAEQRATDAEAATAAATAAVQEAEARVTSAEIARADAQATARTLREIIDSQARKKAD